jgi:hypothetical protein
MGLERGQLPAFGPLEQVHTEQEQALQGLRA